MLELSTAAQPATTAAALAAAPKVAKKRRSFANGQTRALTQFSTTWQSLSGAERTTWQTVAQQFAQVNVNGAPSRVSAYMTFVQCNTMLQGAGLPTTRTFNGDTTRPFAWPELTLSGVYDSALSSLVITSPSSYGLSIVVYAAPPLLPGANNYTKKSFRRIGALPGLDLGANSVKEMYLAKYRVPTGGYEIALRLVAVMDSGLHTKPYVLTGIVGG